MQQPFSRKMTALALAVSLALTLGACGGDDDPVTTATTGGTTTGTGTGTPTAPAAADAVLTSIQSVPTIKEIPFEVPATATCPTTSHPFSTMLCTWGENFVADGTKPVDIKQYGYTEKEFLQSGKANVYDLDTDERAKVRSAGNPYATRLLVRYPTDAKKFSGRVYIDILNASSGVDLEDTWRRSWKHLMQSGDAYIGITSKSLTADALKKFDPTRYAELNWKVSGVNEDGLFWDMLSQLGTQLRQSDAKILGSLQPKYVYLAGQSQSGFYMNTYITAFTDRLEKAAANGKPLFDGYLNLVGPGAMPLRSEAGVPTVSVPKKLYKATSVPQIVLMSEGESRFYDYMGAGGGGFPAIPPYSRRADSSTATDKFRFYEVAGAPHADPTSPIIPINSEIMKAKADGTGRSPKPYAAGHEEGELHLDEFVSAALENLHDWAANGTAAPVADAHWMWYSTAVDAKGNLKYTPLRDQYGNALGGLRSPMIEAPLYQYFGMTTTATGAPAVDWGSAKRLPDATINGIYGGSCDKYVANYYAASKSLLDQRYLHSKEFASLNAKGKALATKLSDPLATGTPVAINWTTACSN